MLLGFADGDFDGRRRWWWCGGGFFEFLVLVDDGLDGVAEEFSDDVFEVAEDIGEAGVEVAVDFDFGDLDVGAVGGICEGCDGFGAAVDDILGGAFDEDLADEVGFGELGARGEVW